MGPVHIENVIDGSPDELSPASQKQRMNAVDRLCHICHGDFAGMRLKMSNVMPVWSASRVAGRLFVLR
jgi:hypothetical protein